MSVSIRCLCRCKGIHSGFHTECSHRTLKRFVCTSCETFDRRHGQGRIRCSNDCNVQIMTHQHVIQRFNNVTRSTSKQEMTFSRRFYATRNKEDVTARQKMCFSNSCNINSTHPHSVHSRLHNVNAAFLTNRQETIFTRRFHTPRTNEDNDASASSTSTSGVLDEARERLGNPNWLNMFRNSLLAVTENTGSEDVTSLLVPLVEHYFLDDDFETECLIVLLLAAMSDKLVRYWNDSSHPHHRHQHSTLPRSYNDFRTVSNPGHVSLANSLFITRILLLQQQQQQQQLATEKRPTQTTDTTDIDDNCACTCTTNGELLPDPVTPCSKLDKIRVLLSDIFIGAVYMESARTGNPLILQYSFQAMSKAIEGTFRGSLGRGNTARASGKCTRAFREDNTFKKMKTPFQSTHFLGSSEAAENGIRRTVSAAGPTKINKTFGTLSKAQALYEDEMCNEKDMIQFEKHESVNINTLANGHRGKLISMGIPPRTSLDKDAQCKSLTVAALSIGQDVSDRSFFDHCIPNCMGPYRNSGKPQLSFSRSTSIHEEIRGKEEEEEQGEEDGTTVDHPDFACSAFMTRRESRQGLYCWGWTEELSVICQGSVALAGLRDDMQQSAFKFGRSIPFIRQIQWHNKLDTYQEKIYLARLESYLGEYPDCANKRLLIALCKAYITKPREQQR